MVFLPELLSSVSHLWLLVPNYASTSTPCSAVYTAWKQARQVVDIRGSSGRRQSRIRGSANISPLAGLALI